MDFNFNNFGDINQQVTIEIQLGNQIVEKTQLPTIFAKQHFLQVVQQIKNDGRPIKIKCTMYDYTETGKMIENSLTFRNLAFLNNFKEE